MRLLHFDHPETPETPETPKRLILTDFTKKKIPEYAILSHRWGDGEVLFEDVRNNNYKAKKGYRKIEFCAEKVAQDEIQYFWVDTCCIDKWNLDELEKSINSMFLWYQKAKKCYVFLPDVSVPTVAEIAQGNAWEVSFRASAWFTRGWTLQELIAPDSVEFFSSEGRRLGDKQTLEQQIHDITRLPVKALQRFLPNDFTISERMEWSKKRETTEPEDKVYCLLGILDVFMPTPYGEGIEKARTRLQAELDTATGTPSIIPFSRNDHFVGRESQLAELEAGLFGSKQPATMAIVGPGGTGKSQLALELAYRTRKKNKSCSVFWIDASNIDSLYQSFAGIARKLSIPGWDDEKADVKHLVKRYLSRSDGGQFLLIFDSAESVNLESVGLSKARAAKLIDYIPRSEQCSILFTTTSSNTAKRLALQNIVGLEKIEPHIAQNMLENYLKAPLSTIEQPEVELLLQELSHLPLALVQAAAYINKNSITLKDYRSRLSEQKIGALKRNSELLKDKQQESSSEDPVAWTLLLSIDQIRRENPLAVDYLSLAACLDRKDISLELLGASLGRKGEDAIRILNSYAIITRRPAESAIDIHRLVHRALREWLRNQGTLGQWTQTAIVRLLSVFPDHSYGNTSKWRRLLPHAKYALSQSSSDQDDEGDQDGADKTNLIWKCAMALLSDGQYSEAEQLFVQVMDTSSKVFGDEHPSTLVSMVSMVNLVSTYRDQGRWKEAEQLGLQVMETSSRVLGGEHPFTLTSMSNLASTYGYQERWTEAEQLFVQVMETRKRVLGDEHPDTLTSMTNLATAFRNPGRWTKSEQLFMQVMETSLRVLGDDHPSTLTSMSNLATTYRRQGRWTEAEKLDVQVTDMSSRVLGDEHPDTLICMSNLASTYRHQGQWTEAERLDVQVMETRKRMLGVDNPDTLICMTNLASTYRRQGRWTEAERLDVQVMDTSCRVLGDEHPFTLTGMSNLALTYRYQEQWMKAEQLDVQVLETRKRVLGDEHPDTLTSMNNLAFTFKGQGHNAEAISLMETLLQIGKRVFGPEHPNILSSSNTLDEWRGGRT